MRSYSRSDVILVRYPFSDLSNTKVRPAVVVSDAHASQDILITPLTSKLTALRKGEFILTDWAAAGLNVETAVNRQKRDGRSIKLIGHLFFSRLSQRFTCEL